MTPTETFTCDRAKLASVTRETCARMYRRASTPRRRGEMAQSYSPCNGCGDGLATAELLQIGEPPRMRPFAKGALRPGLAARQRTIDDLEAP